ncbi:response regulator [Deinococcus radiodurans]|jgi:Response regulator containing a CheY-like receiver domain and an HTH DNA-binding domain|nr:response regulator transcription factor [Deinococcus radiodurans]ANC71321.1 DNA-binding response regulator [Deinococcus radiodurans R1 = ATCC 13939 = DSM 20539]QIP29554.1 response regulator transcription factor [Deinococcus radiodurans]QIP31758.1 response regulator transcription factor [Deinococcus radiodurans]UID70534.1 DNA-binding response regulator [Deinococcus radiodurans R1 = ATCC 13939 = DSM 20539]UTA50985.1 response regulator transcription factor [Deinococcus radiodurans]
MTTPTVRVLLVDDHAVVRQGLRLFLGLDEGIEVVGEAANGEEALQEAERLRPEVVVMDLMMPVMDGITATRELRRRLPDTEVIALTSTLEENKVNGAIEAGAISYMLKDASSDTLADAIHAAARGEVRLHPEAARRLVRDFRSPEMRESLTPKETAVLQLLARGQSNKDIAAEQGVSEATVKTHVSRLLSKLGLDSRTQAALYALKYGIASLEGVEL